MTNPFVPMLWIIVGCAALVISEAIEEQPTRGLTSSGSKVSVMAHIKSSYSGSELQSGETIYEFGVCEDVDQVARKLYTTVRHALVQEQSPSRRLSSSSSQGSVMAHIKSSYSGSELQSGDTEFDMDTCENDTMTILHQKLVEGHSSHEQRSLIASGSQFSVMAHIKSSYSGSGLQNTMTDTHQLVACSISKAHSVINDYYEKCPINRCCALEEYVTNFIHHALAYTSYCSLYSDNLNADGLISVSSDFPGPYPEPLLPDELIEYGIGLQEAMNDCESCNVDAKASLLGDLEAVLGQWAELGKTCAETAVNQTQPIVEGDEPPMPLSEEILASREIKSAQNALFTETSVRDFEAKSNLGTCPTFYDYVIGLSEGGLQMMTYTELFSDMCDASAAGEDTSEMPLPEMPSASALYDVNQLVDKRQELCSDGTDSDNMLNLFNQVQAYHGIEMASLQSTFIDIHHSCEAVGVNGGQEAPVGAYNHTVNLRHTAEGQGFCGGILFTPTHVLTAAHCLNNAAGEEARFVSVVNHFSKGYGGSEVIQIKSRVPHPDYDSVSKKNDIMIVELVRAIDPSKNIMIAQLGELSEGFEEMGMAVKMTGWGSDSALTSFSHVMKEHALNLETTQVCDTMLDEDIDDSFVCSKGNFGSAVCYGDSGGPLQLINHHDVTARPIIVGIVNFGVPCGLGRPDVFARISHYKDWITDELNKPQRPSTDRKLLSTSYVDPWISPSLDEFMNDELSKLREGQIFRCLQYSKRKVYMLVKGYRQEFNSTATVTKIKTVDCSYFQPLRSLLKLAISGFSNDEFKSNVDAMDASDLGILYKKFKRAATLSNHVMRLSKRKKRLVKKKNKKESRGLSLNANQELKLEKVKNLIHTKEQKLKNLLNY